MYMVLFISFCVLPGCFIEFSKIAESLDSGILTKYQRKDCLDCVKIMTASINIRRSTEARQKCFKFLT